MDTQTLSTFLLAIHDNARALPVVDFKAWMLRALKPHLRFDSALIGMGQVEEDMSHIPTFHLDGIPVQAMADRDAISELDVVGPRATATPGKSIIVRIVELELDRAKYQPMIDFTDRYGLWNVLCTAMPPGLSGMHSFISLFRSARDDEFSEHERALKELLMPHIAYTLALNRLESLRHFAALSRDRDRTRAVADRHGNLYEGGEPFTELVASDWPMRDAPRLPDEFVRQFRSGERVRITGTRAIYDVVPTNDMFFISARERATVDELSPREQSIAEAFASHSID